MKHKCYNLYTGPTEEYSHEDKSCSCTCAICLETTRLRSLPEVNAEEREKIWNQCTSDVKAGSWQTTYLSEFGGESYIFTTGDKPRAVARLIDVGNFSGMDFVAWCRDGVPRLLKTIERLEKDNSYVESYRKIADDKRGAWEHQVLVKVDLERKIIALEKENKELKEQLAHVNNYLKHGA